MRGYCMGMLFVLFHGYPVLSAMLHWRMQGCGVDMREMSKCEEYNSSKLLLKWFLSNKLNLLFNLMEDVSIFKKQCSTYNLGFIILYVHQTYTKSSKFRPNLRIGFHRTSIKRCFQIPMEILYISPMNKNLSNTKISFASFAILLQ